MSRPPVERDGNGLLPVEAVFAENYVRYRDTYTACRDAREQCWGRSKVGSVAAIQKHAGEMNRNVLVQNQIGVLQTGVREKLELDQMWFIRFLLEAIHIDPTEVYETYEAQVTVSAGGEFREETRTRGRIKEDLPPHIRRMIQGIKTDANGIPIAVEFMNKTALFKMLAEISGATTSPGQQIADGLAALISDIQEESSGESLIAHTLVSEQ